MRLSEQRKYVFKYKNGFTGEELIKNIKHALVGSTLTMNKILNNTEVFEITDELHLHIFFRGLFTYGGYGPRIEVFTEKYEPGSSNHVWGDTLEDYHKGFPGEIDFGKLTLREFLLQKAPTWLKEANDKAKNAGRQAVRTEGLAEIITNLLPALIIE